MDHNGFYTKLLAAYVRGVSLRTKTPKLPALLTEKPLESLTEEELDALYDAGKTAELRLYRFKIGHEDLPRIRKVLGFLRGVTFESLLDVGSGRGAFLFPLLHYFPWVQTTSLDILPYRVEFLRDLTAGGVERLDAREENLCDQPFPENSFDIVTLLEVLEHIPEVEKAVQAAVAMARKFVVVTVPSQPDDNPEHIHLLTKRRLTELFQAAGCQRLRFDGVNGHLILVATMNKGN